MNFFPYIGSKGKLAKTIINKMPEHLCYVEVFGGAGNVLLQKEPSKVEVLNDINKELITLYRVVQNHLEEFLRHFKWALVSRDEFERQLKADPETLTDIQRAVRFYYIQKTCFGGKAVGRNFGYSVTAKSGLNLLRLEEDLSTIHLRLVRVNMESLPYAEVIKRYDRIETFFYLDPPSHKVENYYGKGIFAEEDYSRLAEILINIKGKFILSINDTPFIREVFHKFKQEDTSVLYTVNRDGNKTVKELLITNY